MSPAIKPTVLLALFDLKKEPCPQSWKIMKTRTRKSAANAANPKVSGHENETV